ncbi:MAG: hypothetical protein P1U74_01415 [Legionellaceae bacterium]|nr:hypothetical protein [Legionellaceae bacterium]
MTFYVITDGHDFEVDHFAIGNNPVTGLNFRRFNSFKVEDFLQYFKSDPQTIKVFNTRENAIEYTHIHSKSKPGFPLAVTTRQPIFKVKIDKKTPISFAFDRVDEMPVVEIRKDKVTEILAVSYTNTSFDDMNIKEEVHKKNVYNSQLANIRTKLTLKNIPEITKKFEDLICCIDGTKFKHITYCEKVIILNETERLLENEITPQEYKKISVKYTGHPNIEMQAIGGTIIAIAAIVAIIGLASGTLLAAGTLSSLIGLGIFGSSLIASGRQKTGVVSVVDNLSDEVSKNLIAQH